MDREDDAELLLVIRSMFGPGGVSGCDFVDMDLVCWYMPRATVKDGQLTMIAC